MRRPAPPSPVAQRLASSASFLALGVTLFACQRTVPLTFNTASTLPRDKARPAGVAVDLPSSRTAPAWNGSSSKATLTLQTPDSEAGAFATVEKLLKAMVASDSKAFGQLVTSSARYYDINKPRRSRHLRYALMQRLRRFPYHELDGQVLFDKRNIRVYRDEYIRALPPAFRPSQLQHAQFRQLMRPGARLLLHVPMLQTSVANERVFGDHLVFWLVPEKGQYRVVALFEDAPL